MPTNDTTKTASELLDEITMRLGHLGGTTLMVCRGASSETDTGSMPILAPIQAGLGLLQEIEAISNLAADVSEMIYRERAALAASAPPATSTDAPAPDQASTIKWPACWHVMEDAANHIGQLAAVAECLGGAFREDTGTPISSGAAAAEEISEQLRGVKRLLMDALNVELTRLRAGRAAPSKESDDSYPDEVIQETMGFYRQLPVKQQSMVGQLIEDLLNQQQEAAE